MVTGSSTNQRCHDYTWGLWVVEYFSLTSWSFYKTINKNNFHNLKVGGDSNLYDYIITADNQNVHSETKLLSSITNSQIMGTSVWRSCRIKNKLITEAVKNVPNLPPVDLQSLSKVFLIYWEFTKKKSLPLHVLSAWPKRCDTPPKILSPG